MDYTVRTREQLKTLLVAFRKAGKLTQAELAASLGITQQALSALEGEPSNASFERILNLLSALNVDLVLRTREHTRQVPPILGMPSGATTVQRDRFRIDPKNKLKPNEPSRPNIPILGGTSSTGKTAQKPTKPNSPTRKRDEW